MAARRVGKRALAASLVLHALVVVIGARSFRAAPNSPEARRPDQLEVEIVPAPAVTAEGVDAGTALQDEVKAPRAGGTPRSSKPSEPSSSGEETLLAPDANAAAPQEAASSTSAGHLTLAQLGVDGANPFLDHPSPAAVASARAVQVKERLDHALAQGTLDQDRERGAGSASPLLRALETAVYASTIPLNGQATLAFVIDGSGKIVASTLGTASGSREAWLSALSQTKKSLSERTLKVPKGKSVKVTIAVSSRLELPSGADPGFEVDVLGVPAKKGGGKRSTRLEILNPLNPLAPLSLAGDPADIGSRPRRVVNAHVVSEELL
jgi:hypothetical protein